MVVGGQPVPELTDLDILERRKLLVEWWQWACGWPEAHEIAKSDPRYIAVTEGRDYTSAQQEIYSSCADLAHGGYEMVGVRTSWLNRQIGPKGWRVRKNVTLLYPEPVGLNPVARVWTPDTPVDGGDVLIIGTAGLKHLHVVCVLAAAATWLDTAQYGVNGMRVGGIGGRLKMYDVWDRRTIGDRKMLAWLPLDAVLVDTFQRGQLVAPTPAPQTYAVAP